MIVAGNHLWFHGIPLGLLSWEWVVHVGMYIIQENKGVAITRISVAVGCLGTRMTTTLLPGIWIANKWNGASWFSRIFRTVLGMCPASRDIQLWTMHIVTAAAQVRFPTMPHSMYILVVGLSRSLSQPGGFVKLLLSCWNSYSENYNQIMILYLLTTLIILYFHSVFLKYAGTYAQSW